MDPTTRGILIGWAIVIILMALGMGMGLRLVAEPMSALGQKRT
jgi:hypothetical protein